MIESHGVFFAAEADRNLRDVGRVDAGRRRLTGGDGNGINHRLENHGSKGLERSLAAGDVGEK